MDEEFTDTVFQPCITIVDLWDRDPEDPEAELITRRKIWGS